jgi:hypothetical protein
VVKLKNEPDIPPSELREVASASTADDKLIQCYRSVIRFFQTAE